MLPATIAQSHRLYLLLLLLVIAQRLVELAVSRRNERRVRARGALEFGAGHYPVMVTLHAAFLVSCPAEVLLLGRPFIPWLGFPMLALLLLTQTLRYWAIVTLGERWTTRILVLTGTPPVLGGPYRFIRHPNYLAVIVEVFALPLVHTAWITALAFSLANAALLRVRIRAEEAALSGASRYQAEFGDHPRFLPRP